MLFIKVVMDPRCQTEVASEYAFSALKDESESKLRGNTSQKTGILRARFNAERFLVLCIVLLRVSMFVVSCVHCIVVNAASLRIQCR